MNLENLERSTVSLPTNVDEKRRATDKYWSLLLIVIVIIWILAGPNVVRRESNGKIQDKINSDNSTMVNTTSQCVESDSEAVDIMTESRFSKYILPIWGNNWVFDVIACNPSFLDKNFKRSGSIVMWAHILIGASLILYAFSIMREVGYYYSLQLFITIFGLVLFIMIFRWEFFFDAFKSPSDALLAFILWSTPELILIIIARTMHAYLRKTFAANNDDQNDNSAPIYFMNCRFIVRYLLFLPSRFSDIFFGLMLIPEIIILYSIRNKKYEVIWNNEWSHIVALLVIVYAWLIIYYYLLMVTSYVSNCVLEKEKLRCKDFLRGFFIIIRYHFGTVCYHATLILPRLHTTLIVIQEKELEVDSKVSKLYQMYLIHCKVHDLSMMITAARGHNHSEAIKELLQVSASDLSRLKNVQTYGRLFRFWVSLLLAINSLSIVMLWIHGAAFDPRFAVLMWFANFLAMYFTYVPLKFLDATSNVHWYYFNGIITIITN